MVFSKSPKTTTKAGKELKPEEIVQLSNVQQVIHYLKKGDWAAMAGAIMAVWTKYFGSPEEKAKLAEAEREVRADKVKQDLGTLKSKVPKQKEEEASLSEANIDQVFRIFKKGTRKEKNELAKKYGFPTLEEAEKEFKSTPEGVWQENHDTIKNRFEAPQGIKQAAITLDICSNYGAGKTRTVLSVIGEVIKREIPVVFFVTGKALENEAIRAKVKEASTKSYIHIANHGLMHRPYATQQVDASDGSKGRYASGMGKKWGQKITGSFAELYDEVIGGAIANQVLTGKKPKYIRAATLWSTEKGAKIASAITGASMLGRSEETVHIDDGGGSKPPQPILKKIRSGNIFLGHAINPHMRDALSKLKKDSRGSFIVNDKGEKIYFTTLEGKTLNS